MFTFLPAGNYYLKYNVLHESTKHYIIVEKNNIFLILML